MVRQLSKSLIASNTSYRCFKIYSSTINHLFCTVHIGYEVFVTQSFSDYQIDFSGEKSFQYVSKVEVVRDIIPLLVVCCIEVHKKVRIALVVESIRKDRSEDSQSLDPMLSAKADDFL